MWWLILSLLSALFIGIYEVFKKHALNDNDVWLVLLISTLSSTVIFLPIICLSYTGVISKEALIYIPLITVNEHLLILLKTVIVLTSWILYYFALKHLPLTIASPIRSTSPLWTLLGALIIYKEKLTSHQWLGLVITLIFFFAFSLVGRREGISFRNNKWIWFAILGTMFASTSALFDKFLIKNIDRIAVQGFFSLYQVLLLTPVVFIIRYSTASPQTFIWRWSIPLIGIFLVFADFLYFFALDFPDSLISVISILRRGSVVVVFFFGALMFKEKNIGKKLVLLAGILTGIAILILG